MSFSRALAGSARRAARKNAAQSSALWLSSSFVGHAAQLLDKLPGLGQLQDPPLSRLLCRLSLKPPFNRLDSILRSPSQPVGAFQRRIEPEVVGRLDSARRELEPMMGCLHGLEGAHQVGLKHVVRRVATWILDDSMYLRAHGRQVRSRIKEEVVEASSSPLVNIEQFAGLGRVDLESPERRKLGVPDLSEGFGEW
jgi:hypothetical protein